MKTYQYLALGDSYTIGEAVEPALSFPYQLAERLGSKVSVSPTVIAKTGWTTDELIRAIGERGLDGHFDLVTLLIGVNNQYREYPLDVYRKEFSDLLQQAILFAGDKSKVIVVSIPDWGVTPFAVEDKRSPSEIAAQIDCYNAVNQEEAEKVGVLYVSITEASRKAATDPELTATDGLHPSAKMYSEWVDAIQPFAEKVLS